MIQGYCTNILDFNSIITKLQPWGSTVVLGGRSLRFVPHDQSYPTVYVNVNGSIDIWTASEDPFYQDDCLQRLEQWLGETITLL